MNEYLLTPAAPTDEFPNYFYPVLLSNFDSETQLVQSDREMIRQIESSRRDIELGRLVSWDDLKSELGL